MTQIDEDAGGRVPARPTPAGRRTGGRSRRRRAAVAAGVLAVTAGGGVAAATVLRTGPDPVESARVGEVFDGIEDAHLPGWRWELRAEAVTCVFPDGQEAVTAASEFPLDGLLTAELMVEECASGNDHARAQGGVDPDGAEVCVRDGDLPPAVVVLGGASCADAAGARPATGDDFAELNRMRGVEVALLAAPQDCATTAQAVSWAEQVVAARDLDLAVEVTPQLPDGTPAPRSAPSSPPSTLLDPGQAAAVPVCFIARVDWERAVVEVQGGFH
ncbi:MAG TPA: hypothetical protein VFZ77_21140 [Acidimicrobiales bacterium]